MLLPLGTITYACALIKIYTIICTTFAPVSSLQPLPVLTPFSNQGIAVRTSWSAGQLLEIHYEYQSLHPVHLVNPDCPALLCLLLCRGCFACWESLGRLVVPPHGFRAC